MHRPTFFSLSADRRALPGPSGGFSLVEVVLALLVAATGLLSIFGTIPGSLRQNQLFPIHTAGDHKITIADAKRIFHSKRRCNAGERKLRIIAVTDHILNTFGLGKVCQDLIEFIGINRQI